VQKSKKTLQVRREALAELTPGELAAIEGGMLTPIIKTLPPANCVGTIVNCWNSEPCPGTSNC
jgi:hypothetical protein